jgi:HK97 family phage portal protein
MMISLLLRGNAYARWTGNPREGGQLIPLDPGDVSVRIEDGQVVYRVQGIVTPNVFHMRGYTMPGEVVGLSPISYASTMLQTQMSIDQFARGYFRDAPHPASVVTTDQPINQVQAQAIKDRIMAAGTSREPLVLGSGIGMKALSVTPEESQFLETQRVGVQKICRIFGVPPEMVGGSSGNSITYANITQRALDFLIYSVQPWLTRFEQSISQILPDRQHTRFDTKELVRMSPTDMAQVDRWRVAQGIRTINEARSDLGLEPVLWGDEPYLPGMSPAAAGNAVNAEAAGINEEQ